MRNLCAFAENAHRFHQAKLLPPFSQSDARLIEEQSLYGSRARAACPANSIEWLAATRVSQKRSCDAQRPGVKGIWKLQRHPLNRFELVDRDIDEMTLPRNPGPECAAAADMKDK